MLSASGACSARTEAERGQPANEEVADFRMCTAEIEDIALEEKKWSIFLLQKQQKSGKI